MIGRASAKAAQRLTLIEVTKRLGDAERDRLLVVGQRPRQPVDEVLVEDERDDEAGAERDQRDQSRRAKLVEVLDE